jgi:hypothetical protein
MRVCIGDAKQASFYEGLFPGRAQQPVDPGASGIQAPPEIDRPRGSKSVLARHNLASSSNVM